MPLQSTTMSSCKLVGMLMYASVMYSLLYCVHGETAGIGEFSSYHHASNLDAVQVNQGSWSHGFLNKVFGAAEPTRISLPKSSIPVAHTYHIGYRIGYAYIYHHIYTILPATRGGMAQIDRLIPCAAFVYSTAGNRWPASDSGEDRSNWIGHLRSPSAAAEAAG